MRIAKQRSLHRKVVSLGLNDYILNLNLTFQQIIGDVSVNWDTWTDQHMSTVFLGLCAQWIDVMADGWVFRSEVLAMHKISGPHDGDNLGRYVIKLLDHVGITSKTSNKVRRALATLLLIISSSYRLAWLHHCGQRK